jgi:hypothetical protein
VPEVTVTAKGRQKRVYRRYATPFEILRQLPGVAGFLRGDITLDHLGRSAATKSDTQAAVQMQEEKRKLFAGLRHWKSLSRFPHPTAPARRWKVENEKHVSTFQLL